MGEIQEELNEFSKIKVSFTPHLVPVIRGILTTSHSFRSDDNLDLSPQELNEIYKKEYKNEAFVKVLEVGEIPHLSSVRGSNYVHIGGFEIDEVGRIVIISAIDNLVKGASGQAIQNMNLICKFKETQGIDHFGLHP
jgi:N-acetyl-gamma-glutamyl-phosphate reductase